MSPPIALALVAAAGNLLGALAVVGGRRRALRGIEMSVAFGAGFMLAVVLVGVLPRVFTAAPRQAALALLAGYLLVHLAQHVVVPHFHFGEETHAVSAATAASALLGLSLHSLFDGVAIAAGFLDSPELGVALFLAVLLHKLPEGVALSSVSLAGGLRPGQALLAAAALGLATVAGVLLTGLGPGLRTHGLALAGGVTLYVAASNLVPEFQAKRGWPLPVAFFGGAAALLLLDRLLGLP